MNWESLLLQCQKCFHRQSSGCGKIELGIVLRVRTRQPVKGETVMRGKKPKERKSYVLRVENGTLVEVTREVYLEWYQSRRRERYQNEKMKKHGVCSLESLEENGCFSVRSDISPEEAVLKKMHIDKLREAMENLPEEDDYLIYLLFFEEVTVKEAAQLCGCSRKTIQNRRKRILKEMSVKMRKCGIEGECF